MIELDEVPVGLVGRLQWQSHRRVSLPEQREQLEAGIGNPSAPHSLGAEWSQSVVFSILILILVFRPEGLLGETTQEKV